MCVCVCEFILIHPALDLLIILNWRLLYFRIYLLGIYCSVNMVTALKGGRGDSIKNGRTSPVHETQKHFSLTTHIYFLACQNSRDMQLVCVHTCKLIHRTSGTFVNRIIWNLFISHSSFWGFVFPQASGSFSFGPFPCNILLGWLNPERTTYCSLR